MNPDRNAVLAKVRSDVFAVLRSHGVSEQCFAEVAMITHAALTTTPELTDTNDYEERIDSEEDLEARERMLDGVEKRFWDHASLAFATEPTDPAGVSEMVEHLMGPHEWGYRDLTGAGFIADDTPFKAAAALRASSAAEASEHFLTAYVSQNGRVVGIEHETVADWKEVRAAHVALRDRLNERLAEEDGCPFKPEADPVMGLAKALRFYANAWHQDADAERTVHGWEGSVGPIEPAEELLNDMGDKARSALATITEPKP